MYIVQNVRYSSTKASTKANLTLIIKSTGPTNFAMISAVFVNSCIHIQQHLQHVLCHVYMYDGNFQTDLDVAVHVACQDLRQSISMIRAT